MEKRILIAFVLSFAVLYGFQFLYPPAVPPADAPEQQAPVPAAAAEPIAPSPAIPPAEGDIRAESAMDETIETGLYTARVSNTGGVLRSFQLKFEKTGEHLELINAGVANLVGWPLAIVSGDAAVDKLIAESNFVVRRDGDRQLSLEFSGQGIHALKTIEFNDDTYMIGVTTALSRAGVPIPHQVVWQGGFGDQSIREGLVDDARHQQAVYGDGNSFSRVLVSSIDEPQDAQAAMAGVEDQYFLAMMMSPQEAPVRIQASKFNLPDGTDAGALYVAVPGGQPLQVYIGPKERESLAAADTRLSAIPAYGWFGFITKPLILALLWIHHYIGNFGWAIVILTIVINVVMFPFRVKQQVSMQKMQKLAPHMKTLQEKYKKLKAGDPKRAEVEAELMKMNKEQMAGCLPSLLQMPLLFAFWSMLSVSIELRRAPWILWIQDLSRHDPYYVLPILMAVSMFISQKMMPTSMDPTQAKMMLIMPVVFLGFFLWAQSGVALYWLTSNVIGIGQQWFIREYWSEDAATARPVGQRKPQS